MGCHLGWHFAVGCPLRGGRGKYKQQGLLFHQKQLRKKKEFLGEFKFIFETAIDHESEDQWVLLEK
jgi:hypothetical protein